VSSHYEVVFSLFLRDDTPSVVLDELRWHLGLLTQRPEVCAIEDDWPQLRPNERTYLPGGEVALLQRQYRYSRAGVEHHAWGLYTRQFWLDDHWAAAWWRAAAWLAPHADGDGYAGFFREEGDERPTLLLIRGGEPYLCGFGEEPRAFSS
jgi:hypothetical protein